MVDLPGARSDCSSSVESFGELHEKHKASWLTNRYFGFFSYKVKAIIIPVNPTKRTTQSVTSLHNLTFAHDFDLENQ